MSLPGYSWEARPDRTYPDYDPLNAWLLEDGFDFLDLGIGSPESDSKALDVTATLGDALPGFARSLRTRAFTSIAPITSRKSIAPAPPTIAPPRSGSKGRKFFMPILRRSVGTDLDRTAQGFQDVPWAQPEGVAAEDLVIVGVIDHAINIAHQRFQHQSGSRVDYAWIQDGRARPDRPVPYGRLLTGPEIAATRGLDGEGRFDALDLVNFAEDRANPLALGTSHGTHVADIAAGADFDDPQAVATRLLTVTLPAFVTQETSGGLLGLFFVQALDFVLRSARTMSLQVGRAIPVVVNFSFSVSGGPRSGGHFIEQNIKRLFDEHEEQLEIAGLTATRPEIFMPAGNRNLARCHAAQDAKDGELDVALPWRLQPEDQTASYLEIWLPPSASDVKVQVTAPGYPNLTADIPLTADTPHLLTEPGDDNSIIARLSLDALDGRHRIFLAVAPTLVQTTNRAPLPAGVWTIRVTATCPEGGTCQAWVMRDDTPSGFKALGRQSYLDDPAYQRFTEMGDHAETDPADGPALVRRAGTSNGLATGQDGPFLVSGFRAREMERDAQGQLTALYSATPETSYNRHFGAVSDTSRTLSGVIAAGTQSGSRRAMNGTSVATPQAVRQRVLEIRNPPDGIVQGGQQTVLDTALTEINVQGLPPRGVRGVLQAALPMSDGIER